jgi:hypothetical protein
LNRKLLLLSLAAIVAVAFALAAVGCGGDDDSNGSMGDMGNMGAMSGAPEGSIRVDLVNWAVEPAQASTKAGKVTFWAVHDMGHMHGGVTHDLQVMKKLPDGTYDMVGQVQGLKMGEAKALSLNLGPGDYELSCNVVETINGAMIPHYAKGMHTAFTVTG